MTLLNFSIGCTLKVYHILCDSREYTEVGHQGDPSSPNQEEVDEHRTSCLPVGTGVLIPPDETGDTKDE